MEEGQFLDAGLEWQYSLCVWGICLAQRFEVDREFGDWREGAVAMMICLLLCQSMNTFTEVVERTQIETGERNTTMVGGE